MSTLNDDDQFLVQRGANSYKLNAEDLMSTINDTDLLLIQRGTDSYKVTGLDVKDQLGTSGYFDSPVQVLTPLNGAGLNAGQSYEPLSTAIVSETGGVITFTDDTELANIVGPVKMVDANGNVKTPQTTAITAATTITGEDLFAINAYWGDATQKTITNNLDMTGSGGLVWIKNRGSSGQDHILTDTVRGANKALNSNSSGSEGNSTNQLKAFGSTGFTIGTDSSVNQSSKGMMAYSFVKARGFMDIVEYTGTGTSTTNNVIPHDLGAIPGVIITKNLSQVSNWGFWHKDLTRSQMLRLDSSAGAVSVSDAFLSDTDTTFTLGQNGTPNDQGSDYVAYLFASDDTNIKCGSYMGNEISNGINCGFRPAFVIIKRVDGGSNWVLMDNVRGSMIFRPNTDDAEVNEGGWGFGFTSTGFNGNPGYSEISINSSTKYVYIAISDSAFSADTTELTFTDDTDLQFLKAGAAVSSPASTTQTDAFSTTLYTGNSSTQSITTGIDNTKNSLLWLKKRNSSGDHILTHTSAPVASGRTDLYAFSTNTTGGLVETPYAVNGLNSTGFDVGGSNTTNNGNMVAWNFRAAPNFMDIVTWTGNGSTRNIPHGLTSVPGMMIVKKTSGSGSWEVYHTSTGNEKTLRLNSSNGQAGTTAWDDTTPTSTHFTLSSSTDVNQNGEEYVAYLFANTGSIKCGTYTGYTSGSGVYVNGVGFKPGWLMVKRATGSGSWSIFDNKRSSATNVDRYLRADGLWGETIDGGFGPYVWFNANGFQIDDRSDSDFNSSGETFIYIAIEEDATAGSFGTNASVVTDADPTTKKMVVDSPVPTGASLTGPTLDTVSTTVDSQAGSTITLSGTTGNWLPNLYAEGATVTRAAPSPSSIVFTSSNNNTTPVTGLDATLLRRVWTLETSSSASGPWTVVGTYSDTAANASQDGSTAWSNPTLSANTYYRVKVKYESDNADALESTYNTFQSGT
jgi:hypothetical protein